MDNLGGSQSRRFSCVHKGQRGQQASRRAKGGGSSTSKQQPLTDGSVNELIKVLVVREDDVASHVKKETFLGLIRTSKTTSFLSLQTDQPKLEWRTKPKEARYMQRVLL